MRITSRILAALASLCAASAATAQPVTIDLRDARVVVLRPMDAWSGDRTRSEETLEALRKKFFGFEYRTAAGERYKRGYPNVLQGMPEDDELAMAVKAKAGEAGLRLEQWSEGMLRVDEPVVVPASDLPKLAEAQRAYFERVVSYQGNPSTLPDRVASKKVLGGVMALASMAVFSKQLGLAESARAATNSRLPQDIYAGVSDLRSAGAALDLPAVDLDGFQTVVVRRTGVRFGDRAGQIVIAFRGDRDPKLELEALAEAIAISGGKGTTEAQVEAARSLDLARRQAIWDACVARNDALCRE